MSATPGTEADPARDEKLASLIGEFTDQLRCGRQPDVNTIVQKHPELADELRQLWALAQLADHFAGTRKESMPSGNRPTKIPVNGQQGTAAICSPLPRMFGDYELLEELGQGGMGVVYKACQRQPERIVAIKMMKHHFASAADLARFRAEPQSTARLEGHPNIVPVHHVGDQDGQPFFTMRYVEGTTLARLAAHGPLEARQAAAYMATICEAVHYAHEQGILHRDLKPSNVLIDRHGQPHVTDFGLARPVQGSGGMTQTGAIVGTPSYMPPEQAVGSRGTLSRSSDVYSLGAILYELLTGRPPFQAATPLDTVMQVLYQDVVLPRVLNPKVDRNLEMICLKCLQKPAELRYQTAAEMADDLKAFLRDEPDHIKARSSSMASFIGQMLRETQNAPIMENWGLLWMMHSVKILVICAVTLWMYWAGITNHAWYLLLWTVSLVLWGWFFWTMRRHMGPVTFIERQIAHVYAAGIMGCISIFAAEWVLHMPVLTMSSGLAIIGAMVFMVKAGMLSGKLYLASAALIATSAVMDFLPPDRQLMLFAVVSALCFFIPGLKYYRQRRQATRLAR
jgi:serine/threonine-protein kinase